MLVLTEKLVCCRRAKRCGSERQKIHVQEPENAKLLQEHNLLYHVKKILWLAAAFSAPKDVVYSFAQVQIARSFSAQGLCGLPRPFGAGRAGRGNWTIKDDSFVPLFSHPRGREVRGG